MERGTSKREGGRGATSQVLPLRKEGWEGGKTFSHAEATGITCFEVVLVWVLAMLRDMQKQFTPL